jgi:hypothetical protein
MSLWLLKTLMFNATVGNNTLSNTPSLLSDMDDHFIKNGFTDHKLYEAHRRSNKYNTTDWSKSRFIICSAPYSDLSKVIELVPIDGPSNEEATTSEFGRRVKIAVQLANTANEFDYRSHRKKHSKYYRRNIGRKLKNSELAPLPAYQVANYLYGTDSWINAQINPYNPEGYKIKHNVYEYQYNLSRSEDVETVFIPDSSDKSEAIAAGDASGNKPSPIIFNMNMTSPYMYGGNSFYVIGQDDGIDDGDKLFYARVRLLYSDDPLFQFVPVDSIAKVHTKFHASLLFTHLS